VIDFSSIYFKLYSIVVGVKSSRQIWSKQSSCICKLSN